MRPPNCFNTSCFYHKFIRSGKSLRSGKSIFLIKSEWTHVCSVPGLSFRFFKGYNVMNKPMNHIWKMPNSCFTSTLEGLRVLLYLLQHLWRWWRDRFWKRNYYLQRVCHLWDEYESPCRSQYCVPIFGFPSTLQRVSASLREQCSLRII